MTNTTRIHYVTAGLALTGTILAVGSTLTGIPGLPGWAVSSWPIVYGVAITFDRVARILWPDVVASPQTNVLSMTRPAMTQAQWDSLKDKRDALADNGLTMDRESGIIITAPVTLSSDALNEIPDRPRVGQVIDPHDTANAVMRAGIGISPTKPL